MNILLPIRSSAVLDSDPEKAVPIGIGPFASGVGDTLGLQVQLSAFVEPVDLNFGVFITGLDPLNVWVLKRDLTFQAHHDGIVPWKTNVRPVLLTRHCLEKFRFPPSLHRLITSTSLQLRQVRALLQVTTCGGLGLKSSEDF